MIAWFVAESKSVRTGSRQDILFWRRGADAGVALVATLCGPGIGGTGLGWSVHCLGEHTVSADHAACSDWCGSKCPVSAMSRLPRLNGTPPAR